MLRLFVFSLILVHVFLSILVQDTEGSRRRITHPRSNEIRTNIPLTSTHTRSRVKISKSVRDGTTKIVTKEKSTTRQVSNRHKRAIPFQPPPSVASLIMDPRPCTLHSIRYGCICRYGDPKCSLINSYPDEWQPNSLLQDGNVLDLFSI